MSKRKNAGYENRNFVQPLTTIRRFADKYLNAKDLNICDVNISI